jgi:hypothetical protein
MPGNGNGSVWNQSSLTWIRFPGARMNVTLFIACERAGRGESGVTARFRRKKRSLSYLSAQDATPGTPSFEEKTTNLPAVRTAMLSDFSLVQLCGSPGQTHNLCLGPGASRDLIGQVSVRSFFAVDMEQSTTEPSDGDLQRSPLGIPSVVPLHFSSRLQRSPASQVLRRKCGTSLAR